MLRFWLAFCLALAPAVLRAQEPPPISDAGDDQLLLNFRDAQPGAIIESIARATHTSFIVDPGMRGNLTIALEDKVSRAEALEVLNAALLSIGYAPVPRPGGGFTVLPIEAAKGSAPWAHRSVSEQSERMLTTMVRLTSANAADLAKLLAPSDRSSLVIPYPPTNSLIIAAAEDRIAYLLELMRALDQSAATRIQVIPLRWADAGQVATQLDTVFEPGKSGKNDTRPEVPFKVVVDPHTNSLIVQSRPARLAEVRKYVELIDVPKRSNSKVHVVRVMNADASQLAQQLSSISLGEPPRTSVAGASSVARTASVSQLPGKTFTVTADPATNSLLIFADAGTFALLSEVIAEIDRIPARIAIEAHVWDVQTTHALDLGFDALLPLLIPDSVNDVVAFAAFGNPAPLIQQEVTKAGPFLARFTRKPLLLPVIGPDGTPTTIVAPEGGAQFTAAQGEVQFSALSSPYLLAASGEEQHVFAGENVPIPVTNGAANTSATGSQTPPPSTSTTTPGVVSSAFQTNLNITRQDLGIDLRVKPVSVSDDLVLVEVAVEVSAVAATASTSGANDIGPTVNKIRFEATLRLSDGSVVLVASAPHDETTNGAELVPWFGHIPVLGWLFRSTSDRVQRRRLVISLQATQLHSPSEERAEQMERTLAFQRRNQRIQPLRSLVTEPYALLVATRDSREAAEKLLPEISDLPGDPLVVEWNEFGAQRYDVYLTGFREIASLGYEAVRLRERGFTPRLEIAGVPQ